MDLLLVIILFQKKHIIEFVIEVKFMITVDDFARDKIKSMIEAESEPQLGVRIKITGRNLKDYRHELSFVTSRTLKDKDQKIESNEINIYINPDELEQLKGTNITYVDDLWDGGFKVENPNAPVWTSPKASEIQELIEKEINPGLAMHGGFAELIDVKDNQVVLNFGGGCQGCGMASVTVKEGVEKMIKSKFPEIEQIVDATDHASGKNPYYQPS